MVIKKEDNAAENLLGFELDNGWIVTDKISKTLNGTGGFFSVNYKVENKNSTAFLKALNFKAFFQMFPGKNVVEIIQEQTNAFQFEKELLMRCKNNRLSKVSIILDEGELSLSGYTIPNVPYLIFEIADSDLRAHIDFNKKLDISWKLKSLHDIAVGLKQLHSVKIGHQDLKPSNVLIFTNGIVSKIGDLGRSLCADITAPHDNGGQFPGDINYAPPEFLYGFKDPDFNFRIKSTDTYLFGSLIVFYFTGAIMTSLIAKNLDPQFKWNKWKGTFNDVKDYLVDAFFKSIKEFKSHIIDKTLAEELASIIEYCCFPIPKKRGHPRAFLAAFNRDGTRKDNISQFDLQRVISRLDYLSKKYELKLKKLN